MKYKIEVDNGKPYELEVNGEKELENEMRKLKADFDLEPNSHFDFKVFDEDDTDVSESQFMQEMVADIIGEDDGGETNEKNTDVN